ncbi:MAG: protein translocase subunit SecD [Pseudomonadota bacterium]
MLDFPVWKTTLIVLACTLGLLMALPNLFYDRVERANDAEAAVEAGLTPPAGDLDLWPSWAPSNLVNLGLDLRGGAHVLVEVQVQDVYAEQMESLWPEVLRALRDVRDSVGTVRRQEDGPADVLRVRIGNQGGMAAARQAVQVLSQPILTITGAGANTLDIGQEGDDILTVTLSSAERAAVDERTMAQSLEIVRRRVDEAGTREPTVQRQGADRILIQVPGLGSAEELLALLGQTAKLTFNHVNGIVEDANARPSPGNLLYPSVEEPGIFYEVERRPVVSGEQLDDAQPGFDQANRPAVIFRFNPQGGRLFGEHTARNIGRQFAIVLDDQVISAPVIQDHIPGGSGQITGNFSVEETNRLSILLRAGALPAEIIPLEQRTIGPELGQDSVEAGRLAAIVGFVAVLVFMALGYGLFGIFANIALLINVGLILGLLSLIGATLTLPGIAGIVLTIGMAVDANVLVFERIREELGRARGPARAIEQGYQRALSAIIDANLTTFIAALILYAMGSGPVRGFAVTLGLGIFTSVFTAFFVTRMMVALWLRARAPKTVTV